jgi:hypothetical protein
LIEDPDEQREGFKKAIKLANKAILNARIIAFPIIFLANASLSSDYRGLALIETNAETKRILFEKSLKAAREYYNPKFSICLHYSNILTTLFTVLYNRAKIEKDAIKKSRLLKEALQIQTEVVSFVQEKRPESRLQVSYALSNSSLIQYELTKIEPKREKRIELLKDAAIKMGIVTKEVSESLNTRFSTIEAGYSGRCHFSLGEILSHLYLETKEKKIILQAIQNYDDASKLFCRINLETHAAESSWHKAILEDQLGKNIEAATSYQAAAKNYEDASSKIPQLKDFYKNYSLYMQAWSQIETARYSHSIEDYEASQQHYEKAAELHGLTSSWNYLASNYLAWAIMEEAEGLSRNEKTQQAKHAFQQAFQQFSLAEESINQKLEEIMTSDEKEMTQKLLKSSELRRKYCEARVLLEDAKLLDREGKYLQSSKNYKQASSNIETIIEETTNEAERNELELLAILCQAWEKMANAEEATSSESYLEAAEFFEHAKELCYTKV